MNDTDLSAWTTDTDRTDAILEGISTSRRRRILYQLRQRGSTTLTELVDVVGGEADRPGSSERTLTHSTLFHLDVPKLECLGLVTFDPVSERVDLAVERDEIDSWLDLAIRTDLGGQLVARESRQEPAAGNKEILVVEDDADSAELIAHVLESANDELVVTTVTTAETAMAVLRSRSVDGIISDLRLPAISGLDLLRLVRITDPDCPFVLFTGCESDEAALEALDADVTSYVRKSADPGQFKTLARQLTSAVEGC